MTPPFRVRCAHDKIHFGMLCMDSLRGLQATVPQPARHLTTSGQLGARALSCPRGASPSPAARSWPGAA